jgi:hypothetical protein
VVAAVVVVKVVALPAMVAVEVLQQVQLWLGLNPLQALQ